MDFHDSIKIVTIPRLGDLDKQGDNILTPTFSYKIILTSLYILNVTP